jgi:hypothetical protein
MSILLTHGPHFRVRSRADRASLALIRIVMTDDWTPDSAAEELSNHLDGDREVLRLLRAGVAKVNLEPDQHMCIGGAHVSGAGAQDRFTQQVLRTRRSPSQQEPATRRGDRMVNRIARAMRRLASQDVARDNAAGAAAEIRQHLEHQQDVEAYLADPGRKGQT